MTLLLEVAVGDAVALKGAQAMTGRSEETLQKAAGFFVEQVLLSRRGDNYRVLGAARDTPAADMRRHMAFLLKWLHPDLFQHSGNDQGFNRSAYVNLVTQAWETLKTDERRQVYDKAFEVQQRSLNGGPRARHNGKNVAPRPMPAASASTRRGQERRSKRPVFYRIEQETFWTKLLSYLGRFR